MRQCAKCRVWYHEHCKGLESDNRKMTLFAQNVIKLVTFFSFLCTMFAFFAF